ncbi:hypothetical protein PTSG_12301 [Salpingoeca rosetta]|uniref:PID domain-containing protein n=1 Tax=Salpingoeca rosetta (strain ATCC 50818 / BSB-021) TaxID=946362 RepID=F2UA78_SALR5|nr:uncharacterized protein PTSG_12301 [Salpingoeca rosetta]EGD73653.1 hypothetical protein PTSG_12301 [Salpingoeca rosetta]|eukprot:XP_004993934.1 hypothetical protein PTSG_12301 [Salpingoeca rosetta]
MSVCEFKGVGYAGSAPYPVTAAPAVFDTKAMLASLPSKGSKKKKMLLRVSPAEVTLVDSKSLESKVRVPAPLITWAKHDEELHCIVIMDTYATPPQCHFIISKQHAETVFRHIMHRLGVQTRMDRAQQNPQEHTAVKERDVCEEDFPQSFEARFLGSLTVTGRPGAHVVKESLQFIKRQLKKHEQDSDAGSGRRVQGNNVAVIVSLEGLRALDVLTRATITSLLIASITYLDTVQDEEEGEILAIIAYDDRLDRHNLQLFQCADGQTQDLIKLLEFASVQHQTVASKEAFNPFVPEEGHDIQSLDDFKVSPRLLAKSLPRECLAPVKPLESGQYGKYYLATFTQVDAQHDQQFGLFSANGAGDGDDDGDGGMTAHAAGSSPHLAVYVIQSDVSQTERAQMLSGYEVLAEMQHPNIERGYTLRSRTKLALRWLAVETFTRSPRVFSEASDVWAFGVTTWEIFTGLVPYHDMRLTEVHQEVPKGLRPPRPPGCHDSLWTLLTTTWSADSTIRPTFAVIRDRLAREMDAFPDQELHDIGKMVNDKLHAKIETLSRNATERHRKRSRRSSRDSVSPLWV